MKGTSVPSAGLQMTHLKDRATQRDLDKPEKWPTGISEV